MIARCLAQWVTASLRPSVNTIINHFVVVIKSFQGHHLKHNIRKWIINSERKQLDGLIFFTFYYKQMCRTNKMTIYALIHRNRIVTYVGNTVTSDNLNENFRLTGCTVLLTRSYAKNYSKFRMQKTARKCQRNTTFYDKLILFLFVYFEPNILELTSHLIHSPYSVYGIPYGLRNTITPYRCIYCCCCLSTIIISSFAESNFMFL